jgi:hypothetical protein
MKKLIAFSILIIILNCLPDEGFCLSTREAFIFTKCSTYQELELLIDNIVKNNGRVYHVFPVKSFIGNLSSDCLNNEEITQNIVYFNDAYISNDDINKILKDDYAKMAASMWNQNHVYIFEKELPDFSKAMTLKKDLLIDSTSLCNTTNKNHPNALTSYGAGFCDTSEYMIGTISVNIIFPESQGEGDENTENWETYIQGNFLIKVEKGLDWWVKLEPAANLRFVYEWMTKPVSIEPINHVYCDEEIWTTEIMQDLGFTNYENYLDKVREFDNAQKGKYGTDWAYTIFCVNAQNDTDGYFNKQYDPNCQGSEGNWFAYSWMGGPSMVIAYKGNSIYQFDVVTAHETAHIFYAQDEYQSSGCYCTDTSGYLDVENQNCNNNCLIDENCLMRDDPKSAFYLNILCKYTRDQIGWRDSDGDLIFDILDFDPESSIITISQLPSPTIRGIANGSKTLKNLNNEPGNNITLNKIAAVNFRVDGSKWKEAYPEDGRFDSPLENFNAILSVPLTEGSHKIEIWTRNNYGNESVLTLDNAFSTENLYLPVTQIENTKMILLATNFSNTSSDFFYSFNDLENSNLAFNSNITLTPHQTRTFDLDAMGLSDSGLMTLIKIPETPIKFNAYTLNFNTLKGFESRIIKPVNQDCIISFWLVNHDIAANSLLYIYNINNEKTDFEISIKDDMSKQTKTFTESIEPSKCDTINLSSLYDSSAYGYITIHSEGKKIIALTEITRTGYGIINRIYGEERSRALKTDKFLMDRYKLLSK